MSSVVGMVLGFLATPVASHDSVRVARRLWRGCLLGDDCDFDPRFVGMLQFQALPEVVALAQPLRISGIFSLSLDRAVGGSGARGLRLRRRPTGIASGLLSDLGLLLRLHISFRLSLPAALASNPKHRARMSNAHPGTGMARQ